jgi:hypothetical protein
MKNLLKLLVFFSLGILNMSCSSSSENGDSNNPNELTGSQSAMGIVGVSVSSSSAEIAGVSNFSAVVTSLENGISSYTAQATVTNPLVKNMIANFPGVVINGNSVSISNLQIKQTTDGIKCITGPLAGVLVKYDASVGDTFTTGSSGKVRTVVSKTGVDDYPYGMYLIKTIQVESTVNATNRISGISKITYIANHKFGMVGVKVNFEDGTSATFPIYTNAEN